MRLCTLHGVCIEKRTGNIYNAMTMTLDVDIDNLRLGPGSIGRVYNNIGVTIIARMEPQS